MERDWGRERSMRREGAYMLYGVGGREKKAAIDVQVKGEHLEGRGIGRFNGREEGKVH